MADDDRITHRHVVVNATVTHFRDNLAPAWSEHDPYVKLFLDRSCERSPAVLNLDTNNPNASYQVQVTGLPRQRTVHNLFAMGIKAYVHTQTKLGVPVSSDAGQDFILLGDVLDAHQKGLDYQKNIELRMPSVDNLLKGTFTVTIARGDLQMTNRRVRVFSRRLSETEFPLHQRRIAQTGPMMGLPIFRIFRQHRLEKLDGM